MRTLLSLLVVYAQLLNDALYPLVIRLQLGQYVFHRALDQSACYHPEALSVWVFVVDLPQCLEDQAAGGCEVGFSTEEVITVRTHVCSSASRSSSETLLTTVSELA